MSFVAGAMVSFIAVKGRNSLGCVGKWNVGIGDLTTERGEVRPIKTVGMPSGYLHMEEGTSPPMQERRQQFVELLFLVFCYLLWSKFSIPKLQCSIYVLESIEATCVC